MLFFLFFLYFVLSDKGYKQGNAYIQYLCQIGLTCICGFFVILSFIAYLCGYGSISELPEPFVLIFLIACIALSLICSIDYKIESLSNKNYKWNFILSIVSALIYFFAIIVKLITWLFK